MSTLPESSDRALGLSGGLLRLRAGLSSVIRGQEEAVERLLIGLVAGGHVLVEDVPGVGKTTLAKALARGLEMSFSRVQCTPDLLPSDILGSSVLDPRDGSLTFRPGPIFANVVLVDETNRASPRTQSGLLEAMNEGQVTVDGSTRPLPDPFFVVATQNPVDFQGTFPLPAAQLDRFLLRVRLGYPSEVDELEILSARRVHDPLNAVQVVLSTRDVLAAQAAVKQVTVVDGVAKYLLALARATRTHTDVELGTSTRGALGLYRASQARAFLRGRDYVSPDDVQAMAEPVLAHRLVVTGAARYAGRSATDVVRELVLRVPVPL
ncbi:MAG: MoxR family ATPase [Myxococcales bacterium]|nr:MoxR family ATPase [Myxococcales bacterium]